NYQNKNILLVRKIKQMLNQYQILKVKLN
ncbi:hypothetical protein BV033_01436B, partial [Haemophilus influenzae]